MPEQYIFRCPCCGQMAPIERLGEEIGPFPLESYLQTFGGKTKLSEEEREARKGAGFRRGSGSGRISYEQLEVTRELQEAMERRISEISGGA